MPNLDALGTPAVPNGHPNEDDTLLNAPDEIEEEEEQDEEEEPEEPSEDEEESEEDEETEEEESEEETDDEKPAIPFDRPTVKELKAEYPDIFKKFPSLRDAYFREIEFTKLFPTIDDAKEAIVDNEAFSNLSDAALEGDPAPLLESLEKTDKKAFEVFSAGFLPALYKRDQKLYSTIVTPVVENLFRSAYKQAGTDDLKKSVVDVAKFFFDDDAEAMVQGKKTFSQVDEITNKQKEIRETKAQETSQKFQNAYRDVSSKIETGLLTLVMKDFDPNKTYSPFVRKGLAQEAVKRIMNELNSDEGHKSVMASRWKRAKLNGYTNEDRSKIVSTFLARAKSLVPKASDKVRSLASGRKDDKSNKRGTDRRPEPRREVNGGRPTSGHSATPAKADLRKMTDMQILEME